MDCPALVKEYWDEEHEKMMETAKGGKALDDEYMRTRMKSLNESSHENPDIVQYEKVDEQKKHLESVDEDSDTKIAESQSSPQTSTPKHDPPVASHNRPRSNVAKRKTRKKELG